MWYFFLPLQRMGPFASLYLIIKRLLLPSENPPRYFYKKGPVIFVIQPALHHLSATQKEKTIRCKNYTRTHRLLPSTLGHPGLCPCRRHTTRRRGRPQPPLLSISTHPPPRPYLCPLAAPVSALEHSFWIKSTRQLQ